MEEKDDAMKKIIVTAIAMLLSASSVGASAPARVVNDGVRSCNSGKLVTWYRYSNGHAQIASKQMHGKTEFILRTDPQGRAIPKPILVNYVPYICVTDAL